MTTARHELTIRAKLPHAIGPWYVAWCACTRWTNESGDYDQLVEDYQVHRDVIDEAARFESQRLDDAVARDMNLGTA